MSTLKVDTITTISGTGNINLSRPLSGSGASLTSLPAANLTGTLPAIDGSNLTGVAPTKATVEALGIDLPAANLTGSIAGARLPNPLPAISGAALTNLPAGGDKRNFIIDGDFTQWPTGTSFTPATNNQYQSALFVRNGTNTISTNVTRSTDTPTVAESNWNSKYSLKAQCSVIQAQSHSEVESFKYHVTGSDYQGLHGQEVTLSFWVKAYQTGDWSVSFWNGASNRAYTTKYTINSSATWERKTITLTLDSSGTWGFTEADVGLRINFILNTGPDRVNPTADTWVTPTSYAGWSLSSQTDFGSSTSNYWQISQVSLTLGSDAPTFTSPPVSTVQNQVEYYVEVQGSGANANCPLHAGQAESTTGGRVVFKYRNAKRSVPISVSTDSTTGSDWSVRGGSSGQTACNALPVFGSIGFESCRLVFATAGSLVAGEALYFFNTTTNDQRIIIDSRH
jgi:hypothetical protein